MCRSAEAGHHIAQCSVVHVDAALPRDTARVNAQLVALVNVVIDDGGERIRCRGNGVEVTGEVQVDILHRHNLGVTAARSAALDAHYRALGGLAEGHDGLLSNLVQGIGQADKHRGFSLAGRCWGDSCHQHELAALVFGVVHLGDIHLGLRGTKGNYCIFRDTCFGCDLRNRLQVMGLCDFNIGWLRSHSTYPTDF